MDFPHLLGLALLGELEIAVERNTETIRRRMLRDSADPFQLIETDFKKHFRLGREAARFLTDCLRPHLQHGQRRNAIAIEIKVLGTLAFFASGSYQRTIGQNLHLALEQSRFSRVLTEVTDAMVDNLLRRFVTFPQTEQERSTIKEIFYEKYQFPGVIGAIDCTHIAIIAPNMEDPIRPGIAYYNRKGFYSINVQMVCDANMKILNCNARFPGSSHDSGIWGLSAVRRHLEEIYLRNELNSSWLIGDSGYPLQPWLLTPVENANPNTPEGRYTRQHILARNVIERCFGVLKQRFRCLLKHRVLHYSPERAAKIVLSCAILHNIVIHEGLEPDEEIQNEAEHVADMPINHDNQNNYLQEGRNIRTAIIHQYFHD